MKGFADPPRSLAVHDFEAIGVAPERQIDCGDNLRERFFDGQPVQVDPLC